MRKCCSRVPVFAVGVVALAGLAACSENPAAISDEVVLLSIAPAGGSVGVDVGVSIVVTFDHAIMSTMVDYAALHEGDVDGPGVDGAWQLSDDGTVLTFTPALPLKAATSYLIHLGGGIRGDHGGPMNLATHGSMHMGGQWATGGGMGGMGGAHPHMGTGWSHPNGSYGMIFSFTTAA
jgi:hypothetical protein